MPIDKYMILRKAAEIDEIINRLDMISDINAAFSGNKPHMEKLQKHFNALMGSDNPILGREKDPDWKERLMRFQR